MLELACRLGYLGLCWMVKDILFLAVHIGPNIDFSGVTPAKSLAHCLNIKGVTLYPEVTGVTQAEMSCERGIGP